MNLYLLNSLFILLSFGTLQIATGIKWVWLHPGDKIPDNSLLITLDGNSYIGRARYFDYIPLAKISNNGYASVSVKSCDKVESVEPFEILTLPKPCLWKSYDPANGPDDENIVRGGTAANGEPIFIGRFNGYIASIYLTTKTTIYWSGTLTSFFGQDSDEYLSCQSDDKWINISAMKVPNNTISGGKSDDGYDIYVARLKKGCDIVTGQVIPELGIATALLNGELIEASYCQVLVGGPNEYTWVAASEGEIPDFAVVHGKVNRELRYVVRMNKTIGHLTHSEALKSKLEYDILVKTQL